MRFPLVVSSFTLAILCLLFVVKVDTSGSSGRYVKKVVKRDPIYLTREIVEPFDHRAWIERSKKEKIFPIIGPVKDIGNIFAKPHLFPCTFSIHSRLGNANEIKFTPQDYCYRIPGEEREICREYEFDLTRLAPKSSHFNPKKRTIITIPGYKSASNESWPQIVREKWLQLEDVSVINVFWPEGNHDMYYTAVANSRLAAREVTILLYYLTQLSGGDFGSIDFRSKIHLVGHSLGAHLAGAVGQELRGQVGRITGLDPAGPAFDKLGTDDRLDSSDGQLVDVIHTNGGVVSDFKTFYAFIRTTFDNIIYGSDANRGVPLAKADSWWGINTNCGHLDYWVNGGHEQPGCYDNNHDCDHRRAFDLYIEAIEYEIQARVEYGSSSVIVKNGYHRLRSFQAETYDDFKNGRTLMQDCPGLVISDESFYEDDLRFAFSTYNRCSLPIDFVSDVEKLRRELTQDYNIQLGSVVNEERKLYLDTQATKPSHADQHLFRLHLKPLTDVDACTRCDITVVAHSANNPEKLYSVIARDLKISANSIHQTDNFYGLTLPYANPSNWHVTFSSPRQLSEALTNLGHDSQRRRPLIRHFFPSQLDLKPKCLDPSPIEEFLGWKSGMNCRLGIKALESKPLVAVLHNVSSWYQINEELASGPKIDEQHGLILKNTEVISQLSPLDGHNVTSHLTSIGVAKL